MRGEVSGDLLLIGEVTEVRGTKVKVRVYSQANEASVFYHGELVRGVSVGGYLRLPCGYDDVIGIVEGDYQQESRAVASKGADGREAPGSYLERYVDVSVFGSFSSGRFNRGIEVLPLVRSKAYLLSPEQLAAVNSPVEATGAGFRVGELAGHDGVDVRLPFNALFASHIGICGTTGSGKSNTLCRLFTDCLGQRAGCGNSKFVFIDFNGEYTAKTVLCHDKVVYVPSTRTGAGGKIPVPPDFFFDVDMWTMLAKATEKTQRPFLKRCIRKAGAILEMSDPGAYLRGMVRKLLEGYCGCGPAFDEQREDLTRLFSLVPGVDVSSLERALDSVEVFQKYNNALHKRDSGELLYSTADVPEVFSDLRYESMDYSSLASDGPILLEFIARYRFIEAVRSHTITREHIAPLIQRYSAELGEASKLYEPCASGFKSDVSVISLLNVNLEQKKVVPLVVAKTLYQFQKGRGQNERGSSTHLVVDEAHNILSYSSQRESENWRDYRLETFEEIVKEGRKFGMYLTVCSQRPADISPTILSQMHNYFIHRLVNDEDLRAIGKAVSFIDGANASMIPVLPQGCCIVSGTATTYPVRVQVDSLELEKQPMSFDRDLAKAWGVE